VSTVKQSGVTSHDYATPFRPRPIAMANQLATHLGRALTRVGLGPKRFTVDGLVAAARRKSGLQRFDDEAFREPLAMLLDSIEREAALTPIGRLITGSRLVGVLSNRLRAQALFERHPQILEEPIVAPLFIAGLQRTGTTMLHRLLAADPGLRALLSWEALNPAPVTARPWLGDPRVRTAVIAEHALAYLAPDFFAIHPVEAQAPEEEVILLDYSFLSTVAEATLHVPSYAAWLEQQDQTPAYSYLKKLLQLLQWQNRGDRWLLKTPHHLEWLDTLLEVFPDAKVIQTHRDPSKTLASFCSMIAHGRGVFSDAVDAAEVGAHWARKTQRMVQRALATRERVGDGGFVDVSYYDLMEDPMAEVARIYAFIGRPLTAAVKARMDATRQENPQNKHGKHSYRLADFGLDREQIEPGYAAYRARFQIRRE
jgi:hypothetical protein